MTNLIDTLTGLLAGLAISAAAFALLLWLYPRLLTRAQTATGLEKSVEDQLLPVVYWGISAAYRATERSVTAGYGLLSGADKKKIADSIYAILPDQVDGHDLSMIKRLLSPEQLQNLIQAAFDQFDGFYKQNQTHFDQEFQLWLREHPAPLEPA
jgi:hypothetical protein